MFPHHELSVSLPVRLFNCVSVYMCLHFHPRLIYANKSWYSTLVLYEEQNCSHQRRSLSLWRYFTDKAALRLGISLDTGLLERKKSLYLSYLILRLVQPGSRHLFPAHLSVPCHEGNDFGPSTSEKLITVSTYFTTAVT